MKHCPKCSITYEDGMFYCLEDGTVLETTDAISLERTHDAPTHVTIPFRENQIVPRSTNGRGKNLLYVLLGALATVVIGAVIALGLVVYFKLPAETNVDLTQGRSNTSNTTPTNQNAQPANRPLTPEKPSLTHGSVLALIERWRISQNTRNFRDYQDCFDPSFFGVKRTKTGGPERMNYSAWMADRKKMLPNVIEVGVSNTQITFDADTAIVKFDQRFRSANHADDGLKEIRIKMFISGPRIVFEELKQVY